MWLILRIGGNRSLGFRNETQSSGVKDYNGASELCVLAGRFSCEIQTHSFELAVGIAGKIMKHAKVISVAV